MPAVNELLVGVLLASAQQHLDEPPHVPAGRTLTYALEPGAGPRLSLIHI